MSYSTFPSIANPPTDIYDPPPAYAPQAPTGPMPGHYPPGSGYQQGGSIQCMPPPVGFIDPATYQYQGTIQ